jgi:DNA-binding transcriptional LysR family regulator
MTLRHLRIFAEVCDSLSMTAAAQRLFMSQPAVSQAIAELEKYYDVRLLDRLSKKLYVTQAGQKLLSSARQLLHINGEIEREMRHLHQGIRIRVGASMTVGAHVLPGLVAAFEKENPGVQAEAFEYNTQKIEQMLLKDQIDFGLVEGTVTSPEIIAKPFLKDRLVLICSVGHRFSQCPRVEPEALTKERWIVREAGSGTRKTFEDAMAARGIPWQPFWVCNDSDTIKKAVRAGIGVSVISELAVTDELEYGVLITRQIEGMPFQREFKIIRHKDKFLTEPMGRFISLCQERGNAEN